MMPMRWVLQHKTAIGIILGLIVLVVAGIWFWGALVGYVKPKDPTGRKDVVQSFALIVAGVVGLIGGIVGIVNVSVARRNLRQQIELEEQRRETALDIERRRTDDARQITLEQEDQRSQDAALQAYFEQMGDLLTDHNLINTDREDIRQLAQAQTLTVAGRLDAYRKAVLIRFLYGAGLINKDKTVVLVYGADFSAVYLSGARLSGVNLRGADLRGARLSDADFSGADLIEANLSDTNLSGANLVAARLRGADLSGADLSGAKVTEEQLAICESLVNATMPNGQKYEDWLKSKGSGEDGKTSGPS
jgi:uncharacterized protein YjbI with pentapeptide repeats